MTEEGGKFARAILESDEIGWVVKCAGQMINGGEYSMLESDARKMADEMNASHEQLVAEAVRKAKEEMRERCAKVCDGIGEQTACDSPAHKDEHCPCCDACGNRALRCRDAIRFIEVKP